MAEVEQAKHNRFGPRILGEEAYRRQLEAQKAETKGGVRLGRRIMETGDEKPAAEAPEEKLSPLQQKLAELRGTEPPAGGTKEPGAETKEPEGGKGDAPDGTQPPEGGTLPPADPFAGEERRTIEQTEEILAERPELFEAAFEAELLSDAPRQGVLKLLLRLEREKPEPREKVLKILETTLAGLKD